MLYRFVVALVLGGILIASCTKKAEELVCTPLTAEEIQALKDSVKAMPLEPVKANEVAVMETNFGTIVMEFFPDKAPQHSACFKRLVKSGYYTCTKFHRVIKDFVIQGGDILTKDNDPSNDGQGDPGYTIPAEFNDIPHDRGILSMARGSDPNSAGSQFFICLTRERTAHLDNKYTVFGRVIEGLDVVDKINNVEVTYSPTYGDEVLPASPIIIEKFFMEER